MKHVTKINGEPITYNLPFNDMCPACNYKILKDVENLEFAKTFAGVGPDAEIKTCKLCHCTFIVENK